MIICLVTVVHKYLLTRSFCLSNLGQRDVKQYLQEEAAKSRASLQLRGKEQFANRMEDENERQIQLQEDQDSHLLDTAAWQDVGEYVKECNRRKRLSLAFRAKEKRHHFQIEQQQKERQIQQSHQDELLRSVDAKFIELAKLKEKARLALASFNHSPSCTFGTKFSHERAHHC